ncbi:MAG: hypothetical protein A3G41_08155 [Elusimicrobia bacterium RIFCSPLOWO2_12_FULL_59_9]|nr:MAG: hypothetical protein A3G41_08155 [Elusimicrobia bacterium RIFCSPLOWO2_12_FULL_59_9]
MGAGFGTNGCAGGLQQRDLARLLDVNRESIRRYEDNETKPIQAVRVNLREVFKLNGEFEDLN